MSSKKIVKRKSTSDSKAKVVRSSVRGTASKEATEEDIFMDREQLLKEKLDMMNKSVYNISEEIRQLQSYNSWLDLAIEDREIQNQEIRVFVDKKWDRKKNHSTTLSDYHAYNIEVLKQEEEQMLAQFAEREKVLQGQLAEEKMRLNKSREELFQMERLQKIRAQQEAEIEQLNRTARQLRMEFAQKVNQLKEDLQQEAADLESSGKVQLKESTAKAKQESIKLVIKKMQQFQDANRSLRDEIWTTRQNISALEKHLDRVTEHRNQLRYLEIQATDLDYLETKRLEGLATLYHSTGNVGKQTSQNLTAATGKALFSHSQSNGLQS